MADKDTLLREYRKVKTVLLMNFPFVASLLNKARVIATTEVDTAAVVGDTDVIAINPEFFMKLEFEDRVFMVAHEVFHWAFRDPERGENKKAVVVTGDGRTYTLWNLVADAVNNDILVECLKPGAFWRGAIVTKKRLWEMSGQPIDYKDFEKMSKEQMYRLLEDNASGAIIEVALGTPQDLDGNGDVKGFVIQEGDEEFYGANEEETKKELMKNFISEAYAQQKQAGNVPAGLKRAVDEILGSKIPWRSKLREAIREGFGKAVVSTYTRLSRKLGPQAPGYKHLTIPEVHIGIDASGSITEKELEQFLGEVFAVAKNTKVYVTPWDAEAYETVEVRSPSQVLSVVTNKLAGGGGTHIGPYLEKVEGAMKPLDIVIVLTDGGITDISEPEVIRKLQKVARKASKAILVTTEVEPPLPRGWETIKLEL